MHPPEKTVRKRLLHALGSVRPASRASVARGSIAAVLLVAGFGAGTLAAACATGVDNGSGDDGGGGSDGTVSDDGSGTDGGDAGRSGDSGRGGMDVATCTPSGTPGTCSAPTSLGSMMPTQMMKSTGNLVPLGQDTYLTVTFNGNTSEDYHPSIALTKGASEFLFDVLSDCSGTTLACGDQEGGGGDGGVSTGLTTWEVQYTGGDFNSDAAAGTDGAFEPIPPVGALGTVLVHLYRRSGLPVSCNDYELTVGN